jgi:uncharacterized membrane protein
VYRKTPIHASQARQVQGRLALGSSGRSNDPAFALRILADIAIRALSPAVNDPTTAVQVINRGLWC